MDAAAHSTAGRAQAGSRALSFFANPLIGEILLSHRGGPLPLAALHEKLGWAAPSTLRAGVGEMRAVGALSVRRVDDMPHSIESELTEAGRDLIFVAEALSRWLARSPDGPIALESPAAKGVLRALTGGWDCGMVRALAERPRTPAELKEAIDGLGGHAVEGRFSKLRATGQVEPADRKGRGARYTVSSWLRHAVAPLIAAARWERLHLADATKAIGADEVEATFLLTLPLVDLPDHLNGECSLAVMTAAAEAERRHGEVAGVSVEILPGEIRSRPGPPRSSPSTWALGAPIAWHNAVIDGDYQDLRLSGAEPRLPHAIVDAIREHLFLCPAAVHT